MSAPDALLLISTHCSHCPAMLSALADLVKQGTIGRLEAVNLEQHPEIGQALGVRSAPWVRIGRIELAGMHSKLELAEWAAKADSEAGMGDWVHMLLKESAAPAALRALLPRRGELSRHSDARVRADACHYLGLTGDAAAKPWLESRLTDDDADVREIATESLQAISG